MDKYLLCALLLLTSTSLATSETDLTEQQEEHLEPVNDGYHYDNPEKDQDKRTIFHNKLHGHAKHVGVHPSGFKYVLGYGGVDLKYVPVLRPISLRPYQYARHHHKVHFAKPLVYRPYRKPHYGGWRPIVPPHKPAHHHHHHHRPQPVIPPLVPLPSHVLTRPWEQEGWTHVHGRPTVVKPTIEVKPVIPAVPAAVPAQPVVPVLPAPPVIPGPSFVPVAKPVVPVRPVQYPFVSVVPQFLGNPPILEVAKPNLPVLPLGASFPSNLLQQIPGVPQLITVPHIRFAPSLPAPAPPLLPQPIIPQGVVPQGFAPQGLVPQGVVFRHQPLLPQPALAQPVLPQPVLPQPPVPVGPPPQPLIPQPVYPPGTVVEVHGTKNFIATGGQLPGIVPRIPVLPGGEPPVPHQHVVPHEHLVPHNHLVPHSDLVTHNHLVPHNDFILHNHLVPHNDIVPHNHLVPHNDIVPHNHLLPHNHLIPSQVPVHIPNDQQPPQVPALVPNPQFAPQIPNVFQQQPPLLDQNPQAFQPQVPQPQGNVFQQQLPFDNNQGHQVFHPHHNIVQHERPQNQPVSFHQHNVVHQELPNDQPSNFHQNVVQQEIANNQPTTLFSEQFPVEEPVDQGRAFQPGQTDLQIPEHLPQHPNYFPNPATFNGGNLHDPQQNPDNVLSPALSLEPPYHKK